MNESHPLLHDTSRTRHDPFDNGALLAVQIRSIRSEDDGFIGFSSNGEVYYFASVRS